MAVALTNLLKKDVFHWFTKSQQTFDSLKTTLTHAPVLALSNFAKPFVLETDASSTGIGAVLSQNSHPIAFFLEENVTIDAKTIRVRTRNVCYHHIGSEILTLLIGAPFYCEDRS